MDLAVSAQGNRPRYESIVGIEIVPVQQRSPPKRARTVLKGTFRAVLRSICMYDPYTRIAFGMAIGGAVGAAMGGLVFGSIEMGMAIGVALGAIAGVMPLEH